MWDPVALSPQACACVQGQRPRVCSGGFRLRAPKGQAWHWFLCEQVARQPDVFQGARGDRQGLCSLRLPQNTLALGMGRVAVGQGRAELAGGA